jgi:hypothetical protein
MGCFSSKINEDEISKSLINYNLEYINYDREKYNPIKINEDEIINMYYDIDDYIHYANTHKYYHIVFWLYSRNSDDIYNFRNIDMIYVLREKTIFTTIYNNNEVLVKEYNNY